MTQTKHDNKMVLQPITDAAWLVQQGEEKVGLLNKDVHEQYTFISGKTSLVFDDDTEVINHFGNASLFDVQLTGETSIKDAYYIGGHLVDYPEPFAVEETHPDYNPHVPLYTKIEGSTVYYAAGYYGINFEKGWKYGNSPKYSTLLKYGFVGPFKTLADVKARIKVLNRESGL